MRRAIVFTIAIFLVVGTALSQQAQPNPAPSQETKYTNDSIARLSFVTGKTFIQRASDLGYEEGIVNMPVTEGDRIGTADGRAEIRFGRGNYLRLDNDTKVDVLNLPKQGDDIARIRVWSGSVYVVVGTLAKEKGIEIHTADSSFYVLDRGVYRIDARENQDTQIFVFNGLIEAAGEEGSVLVKAGQRLDVAQGRFDSKPSTFMAVADDSFDRFNESRDSEVGREYAQRRLPEDLQDFEGELDQYGHWAYVAPYGNVWVPGDVGEDWRPYWNGRWTWLPLSGWTWIPYEPWGWATFHYGRWHWGVGLGWYWIPTSLWGPGWVDWWWDDFYFGWAPLSWWGYPAVLLGNSFYGGYYGGYYPHTSRALTVIRRDQLKGPNVSRVALRGDSLKSLNRMSLSNRTLSLRPAGTRISVQPLDGKRVMIRSSGSSGLVPSKGTSARTLRRPSTSTSSGSRGSNPARVSSSGSSKSSDRSASGESRRISRPSTSKSSGSSSGKSGSPARVGKSGSSTKSSGTARNSGSSSKGSSSKGSSSSATRKKHDPSSSSYSVAQGGGTSAPAQAAGAAAAGPRAIRTYPSSPSISISRIYGDGGAARSGAYLGRSPSGVRAGGRTSSVRSGSSSRTGSSSRGVTSSGRSSSRGSSSRSSGRSSGHSSSGSRSGARRK